MRARLSEEFLERAGRALAETGLDGWLLFDLEGRNRIASEILGIPEGTTRRHFVLVRPDEPPVALAHRIERQTWEAWEGPIREYVGWSEMEEELAGLLEGRERIAMEVSERDGVPFVDQVPHGVVQLVEGFGVRVEGSAPLLSSTCAQWGGRGRELHDRASRELARIARASFERAAAGLRSGSPPDERELADWIVRRIREAGLGEEGVIVAAGPHSALPHYEPPESGSRRMRSGDVFLVDLWARVRDEPGAVFADQTWMGIFEREPGADFLEVWDAVRAARDGAVEAVRSAYEGGEPPTGAEIDALARGILEERGYGEGVLHRTGHGMDRAVHGYGPNLDAVETRDGRRLVPGIGFSVEPGLYFADRWGIRSEINVHTTPGGPVVTTPDVQQRPWTPEAS